MKTCVNCWRCRTYPLRRLAARFIAYGGTHQHLELHDLALCRLTLFDGHRGNEAARLRVADWEDAKTGVWVNPARVEQLSKVEQQLFPCTGPKITARPVSLPGLARPVYYEKSQDPARPGPSTYWAQHGTAR